MITKAVLILRIFMVDGVSTTYVAFPSYDACEMQVHSVVIKMTDALDGEEGFEHVKGFCAMKVFKNEGESI